MRRRPTRASAVRHRTGNAFKAPRRMLDISSRDNRPNDNGSRDISGRDRGCFTRCISENMPPRPRSAAPCCLRSTDPCRRYHHALNVDACFCIAFATPGPGSGPSADLVSVTTNGQTAQASRPRCRHHRHCARIAQGGSAVAAKSSPASKAAVYNSPIRPHSCCFQWTHRCFWQGDENRKRCSGAPCAFAVAMKAASTVSGVPRLVT
jgi:hypothetical protein